MSRPVPLLTSFGAALGVLGAVGWHWQVSVFARLWPPAWVIVPPGPPRYSGVIPAGSVSDWGQLWWPVTVVLPVFGAALGAATAVAVRRRSATTRAVATLVLGLLLGVASAAAWHYAPAAGGGWAGSSYPEVDLGYPAVGLVLGVLAAGAARLGGTPPGTTVTP